MVKEISAIALLLVGLKEDPYLRQDVINGLKDMNVELMFEEDLQTANMLITKDAASLIFGVVISLNPNYTSGGSEMGWMSLLGGVSLESGKTLVIANDTNRNDDISWFLKTLETKKDVEKYEVLEKDELFVENLLAIFNLKKEKPSESQLCNTLK